MSNESIENWQNDDYVFYSDKRPPDILHGRSSISNINPNNDSFINTSPNTFNNVYNNLITNSVFIKIEDNKYPINKLFLDGSLSPFGWSENGYMVFAQFREGNNFDVSSVKILSINSNEVINEINNIDDYNTFIESRKEEFIYEFNGETRYFDELYELVYKITFNEFWEKYNNDIVDLLINYEIISFSDIILHNVDTLNENHNLEIIVIDGNPVYKDHGWSEPWLFIGKYLLINNKLTGLTKKITEIGSLYFGSRGEEMDYQYYSTLDIVGYYKCPFGNAIVFYIYDKIHVPITSPGWWIEYYITQSNYNRFVVFLL
jgi:hypothetical protein